MLILKAFKNSSIRALFVPAAYLLLVLLFFPTRGQFQFDSDEGINLMKAMLVDQGFDLYTDIWNDQPPIFTFLLAGVFRILGYKVGIARMLVLLMAGLLVWSAYRFMEILKGPGSGVLTAIIIINLPEFLGLSVSVMIGLPALALAALSFVLIANWHSEGKPIWLLLSALTLVIGIFIKLFIGPLGLIIGIGIFVSALRNSDRSKPMIKKLVSGLLWVGLVGFLACTFLFTMVGIENLDQLFSDHFAASRLNVFADQPDYSLAFHLGGVQPLLWLAMIGSLMGIKNRSWLLLYPMAWTISGIIILSLISPVWAHHQLLITIPASFLAAYAIHETGLWLFELLKLGKLPRSVRVEKIIAVFGLLSLVFAFQPLEIATDLAATPSFGTTGLGVGLMKERILLRIIENAPRTNWIVTDLPMFAFRARLPVPPELAVFSSKRIETGMLTEDQIIELIERYHPEQILIGRYHFPNLEAYLNENYVLDLEKEGEIKLYLWPDFKNLPVVR